MNLLTRRMFLYLAGAVSGSFLLRYFSKSAQKPPGISSIGSRSTQRVLLNDASELSATLVQDHHEIFSSNPNTVLKLLRTITTKAKNTTQGVAASAARHSLGAHSLPLEGQAITLNQKWISVDTTKMTYRVAAGVRWSEVLATLDPLGMSPIVMQSNNDFGVASTFSVNAHGWPVSYPPFGSTVCSIKMLLASGEHVSCSRELNSELFYGAMGGYGLLGIITELELEMQKNMRVHGSTFHISYDNFASTLSAELASDKELQMAYGRLDVSANNFLNNALLTVYTASEDQRNLDKIESSGIVSRLSRHIFRGQTDSERIKNLRWQIETEFGPIFTSNDTSRNTLLNEPVKTLDDKNPSRVDILHEYFIPLDSFSEFIRLVQEIIPKHQQDLLNVTLRFIDTDTESILRYASSPRIGAVMLFSQEKTAFAEQDMKSLTKELITAAYRVGGSYYLAYRPHASLEQFQNCYPMADKLWKLKQEVDPRTVFRNGFWETYLKFTSV